MRTCKYWLCVLMTFSIPNGFALSLEQAVANAVDTNPRILRQYSRYKAALRDSDAAEGNYYPSVDLKAGIGREDVDYKTGNKLDYSTNDRQTASLTVSQMLFAGFKNVAEASRLDHEAEAERYLLISDSENLALEVCEVYVALEQATQLVLLAERNLQEHQKILDEIQIKVNKGLSSKADLAQVVSRYSSSQSALLVARRKLFDLQAQFYTVVGINGQNLVAPVIDRDLLPGSLEQVVSIAQKSHPEIQSALEDVEAVNEEFRASKADFWPTITLDAEIYDNENIGGFDGDDSGSSIGLNLRYNLFNGLRTTNSSKASGWRYQEAHAIKDQASLKVIEQAKLSWNAAMLLKQQEEILKVNVDAAIATDDGYRKQFEIGRRTLLDVLDAKIEVYRARQNYLSTRYDRLLSEYRLANAMGVLMYALRIDYPEQWKQGE